jgi:hypothetical protein
MSIAAQVCRRVTGWLWKPTHPFDQMSGMLDMLTAARDGRLKERYEGRTAD